jgi:predicted RNase H-like HicB family nuclease
MEKTGAGLGVQAVFARRFFGVQFKVRPRRFGERVSPKRVFRKALAFRPRFELHPDNHGQQLRACVFGNPAKKEAVRNFTAMIERDKGAGLLVGFVPGFAGAHSQGASLNELQDNLREVIEMLLEAGEPALESEFLGTQNFTLS